MSRTAAEFPIKEEVADALKFAGQSRRDDLGYWYYTFRVRLEDSQMDGTTIIDQLVDAGWQLQGGPVLVEASDTHPRHVIVSMLHAEPHPLQIRGELRITGELHGGGELRGQISRRMLKKGRLPRRLEVPDRERVTTGDCQQHAARNS